MDEKIKQLAKPRKDNTKVAQLMRAVIEGKRRREEVKEPQLMSKLPEPKLWVDKNINIDVEYKMQEQIDEVIKWERMRLYNIELNEGKLEVPPEEAR